MTKHILRDDAEDRELEKTYRLKTMVITFYYYCIIKFYSEDQSFDRGGWYRISLFFLFLNSRKVC